MNRLGVMQYMSTVTISKYNGRFANQLFQYMFLRTYARQHGLKYEYNWWPGNDLFDLNDNVGINTSYNTFNEVVDKDGYGSNVIREKPVNVNLHGYFQMNTSYYRPYKDYIRGIFQVKKYLNDQMLYVDNNIRKDDKKVIGIHLRRGDFKRGREYFFITETDWVKETLKGYDLSKYRLYIASDSPNLVMNDFKEYDVFDSTGYDIDCPMWNHDIKKRPPNQFFADFWMLMNSDVLMISNSSFSFAASMLNTRCNEFWRPRLSMKMLIQYDPWNSIPVFNDEYVSGGKK